MATAFDVGLQHQAQLRKVDKLRVEILKYHAQAPHHVMLAARETGANIAQAEALAHVASLRYLAKHVVK